MQWELNLKSLIIKLDVNSNLELLFNDTNASVGPTKPIIDATEEQKTQTQTNKLPVKQQKTTRKKAI